MLPERATRPPPAAFQESRAHFPAGNVKSIPRSQRKKCGLLEFFSFFLGDTWRRRRHSGCCSRSACVWVPRGCRGKTQALRQIKLPIDTSSESHYCPPRPALPPPPSPPAKTPSAAPRTSLGGYFHSHKCWVTEGSTSSQQSGLKFNESLDAYFIVRQASIHHAIHPSGCMSVLTFPPQPPPATGKRPARPLLPATANWSWLRPTHASGLRLTDTTVTSKSCYIKQKLDGIFTLLLFFGFSFP